MLEFKLGCYNSYPLTGISSRDSGLASKEIRIGLEFKNGVLHIGKDTCSQHILHNLNHPFCLAIRLRVIGGAEIQFSAHGFMQTFTKPRGELGPSI